MRGCASGSAEASSIAPVDSGRSWNTLAKKPAPRSCGSTLEKYGKRKAALESAGKKCDCKSGCARSGDDLYRPPTSSGKLVAGPVPQTIALNKAQAARSTRRSRSSVTPPRARCSTRTSRWSCKPCPTPGRSMRTGRPWASSAAAGPMPDSISSCGELTAPPHSNTSRSARRVIFSPRCNTSTPCTRPLASQFKHKACA